MTKGTKYGKHQEKVTLKDNIFMAVLCCNIQRTAVCYLNQKRKMADWNFGFVEQLCRGGNTHIYR